MMQGEPGDISGTDAFSPVGRNADGDMVDARRVIEGTIGHPPKEDRSRPRQIEQPKTYRVVRKCKAAVTETYNVRNATSPEHAVELFHAGARELDDTEIETIIEETDVWAEEIS